MNARASGHRAGFGRRSFLLSLAAGGVLCAAGGPWFAMAAEPAASPWPAWLLDADNAEAVARLGAAYRAAHPEESSRAVLVEFIDRALAAAAGGKTPAAPAGLQALMLRRVRDEYAKGEVVRVTGWILSVTEARLYALVSLEAAAPAS